MPTSLSFDDHLVALERAGLRMAEVAAAAGLDAAVPTCPSWTTRSLLAHQTMVHRWATANVVGDDPSAVPNESEIAGSVDDLLGYFADGHRGLIDALRAAPVDLEALTFLNDAPPPRRFWARRQAHETTIHMVDAMAAVAGRTPSTEQVGIDRGVAEDGIDELLHGFFTRGRSKLFDGTPYTIAVAPSDVDRSWVIHVDEKLTVVPGTTRSTPDDVTVTITGTAAGTYLALWNRGTDVEVAGSSTLLDQWRATQRIRWS